MGGGGHTILIPAYIVCISVEQFLPLGYALRNQSL